jgi:hypothetical protein
MGAHNGVAIMIKFRKIGGIRFLAIGRVRISFCLASKAKPETMRQAKLLQEPGLHSDKLHIGFGIIAR